MSTETTTTIVCPECGSELHADLSDGRRFCVSCRHEWDPANPVEVAQTFADVASHPSATVHGLNDAVSEALDVAAQLEAARARYLGVQVIVHDLGETGTVTEIDDDGIAMVEFASGFYVLCEPDEFSAVETDEIPNETVAAIASTDLAVVAQILRAGAETIAEHDGINTVGMPPDGWLPADPDVMPVIEHGAAYAIAWLATQWGVSPEQLTSAAQAFEDAAMAAREATNQ